MTQPLILRALLCSLCLESLANNTITMMVQLFMWQRGIVGQAHHIMGWFEMLGALDDAPDDASIFNSLGG